MTSAKKIGKQILYGIGKGLYLFGKGLYIFSKAIAHLIGVAYRNYQENERRKEADRQYYREIAREGYASEMGRQHAIGDYREQQRGIREHNRRLQNAPREVDRLIYGEDSPKRRKKRRQFFDY